MAARDRSGNLSANACNCDLSCLTSLVDLTSLARLSISSCVVSFGSQPILYHPTHCRVLVSIMIAPYRFPPSLLTLSFRSGHTLPKSIFPPPTVDSSDH